jgi:energy-coupling factor transporter ATP-binding protein EcfA2
MDWAVDRFVGDLSFGQQRRVALAAMLASSPTILLLDEPTAGLDPSALAAVVELLRSLRGEGLTMLLIEHNLQAVRAVADSVWLMAHGSLIKRVAPHALLHDPAVQQHLLGRHV